MEYNLIEYYSIFSTDYNIIIEFWYFFTILVFLSSLE